MIESSRVSEIFMDCLFKKEEVINGKTILPPLLVEGLTFTVGFHPNRIKEHSQDIISILRQLPETFFIMGDSFLNMCMTKDGELWTGTHQTMEELVMLGIAIEKISFTFSRSEWKTLRGGMPFIEIKF